MLRKRASLAVLFLAVSTLLACCGRMKQSQHLGEWSGVDNAGVVGSFVFQKDGTGKITQGNASDSFRYEIDYSKVPISLDLILTQDGKEFRIKSIIEFIDRDKMRWRTYHNDTRPTAFLLEDPKNTLILTRARK